MNKFRQFYTEYKDKLFGYLLRKTGNAHMAADLAQETFTRYMERYRNHEQSPALLFTIGRNLFYDQMRQRDRIIAHEDLGQETVADQEELFIAREQSNRILAAMAQLGDEERDILALVVSSDLSYQEIAVIRKCSVANIKVKVHRARQKLTKLLQEKQT
jgi:RNA polymerase sigma-70 factor (ECF subfamily)